MSDCAASSSRKALSERATSMGAEVQVQVTCQASQNVAQNTQQMDGRRPLHQSQRPNSHERSPLSPPTLGTLVTSTPSQPSRTHSRHGTLPATSSLTPPSSACCLIARSCDSVAARPSGPTPACSRRKGHIPGRLRPTGEAPRRPCLPNVHSGESTASHRTANKTWDVQLWMGSLIILAVPICS